MKRILSIVLAVLLLLGLSTQFLADSSASLSCSASSAEINRGETVTVTVSLKNAPNAKSVALVFDYDVTNTFSLVSGEWLLSDAMIANFDSTTTACGTAAIAYTSSTNVNGNILTLKLKVKDSAPVGQTTIKVAPVIKNDSVEIKCNEASVSVTIKSPQTMCNHSKKTAVEEKLSTTVVQGWDKYYSCDNCGQLFASDGITEIDEIPYRPLLTPSVNASLIISSPETRPERNDEVTLTISLSNSALAKSVALVFDYDVTNTFSLVSGEWLLSGAMIANFDSTTTACGTAAIAYSNTTDFNGDIFVLKLKVKNDAPLGNASVKVTPVIKKDSTQIECNEATYGLTISESHCKHANLKKIAEKESTCTTKGWAEYYRCDDCGQLFASDGITEIDDVPYYPFRQHSGGEATCKHLAICDYCGQPYGSLNPNNHKGEKETRNKVAATCTTPGYTGDVYCIDCGAILSRGKQIKALGHDFSDDEEYCRNGCGTKNPNYHSSTCLLGDVDGDGAVTIIDATYIQRKLAGLPNQNGFVDKASDTDGDEGLSILDATFIQRWLAGLPSNDNIGKTIV